MYRQRKRVCPGCSEPMQQRTATPKGGEQAVVDVCGRCGGVFFHFFDGEPVALARSIAPHLGELTPAHNGNSAAGPSVDCPDCGRICHARPYLGGGPLLYRCNKCLGLFATRTDLVALAEFSEVSTHSLWSRLVGWLRR